MCLIGGRETKIDLKSGSDLNFSPGTKEAFGYLNLETLWIDKWEEFEDGITYYILYEMYLYFDSK